MDVLRKLSSESPASGGKSRSTELGHQRWGWATFVLLTAFLLLAGCSTGAATTTGTASATGTRPGTTLLCQGVATINQLLTQLSTTGSNTTVGEVRTVQQKLTTALDTLDKLPGSSGPALSNLQSANDQLAAAIKDLPDSATVGEVGPKFQEFKGKVSDAQSAAAKVASTLNCPA